MRLDKIVLSKTTKKNRSSIQNLIKSGLVRVNGKVVSQPGKNVQKTDEIKIEDNPKTPGIDKTLDIKIIYEDKDCLVLDKPTGVLTHSKGEELSEPTVSSWVAKYLNVKAKTNRDFIVHRLDRATSGLIICAKNQKSMKHLQKQFSTRKVGKTYIAVVLGQPKNDEAIIDAPIGRNPKKPSQFRVSENGKSAKTHYKVVEVFKNTKQVLSLIELSPTTGRTHQIRVHMSYIGCPVLGDNFYGGGTADRMYLHAKELKIRLPDNTLKQFKSDLPDNFKTIGDSKA